MDGLIILRPNKNKLYNLKERILYRVILDNETILSISIDEGMVNN